MREKATLSFGSLFAGIGGLDLGLERAGMTCAWQVEKDEFCRKVLTKHWPDVPKYGDIFDVGFTQLPPVDLVCGGFPCQPFSVAGKRQGAADERYLWPELARAVGETKPRWVLLENVPGLLAMAGEFGQVLSDLAALGFDAEWDCIPAAAVGAPHLRYRVFIVAYPKGQRCGKGRERRPSREPSGLQDTKGALAYRWQGNPWATEPAVGRVANGVPSRVDRIKALGNAVVPQVAEWIGRRIIASNNRHDPD